MKVYILVCNWMHDGGNVVNQIAGVFATLKSARKAMAEKFSEDIQNRDYESYRFDKTSGKLWNGTEDNSEDYSGYSIETVPVQEEEPAERTDNRPFMRTWVPMTAGQVQGYLSDADFENSCQPIMEENMLEIYGEGSFFVAEDYIEKKSR